MSSWADKIRGGAASSDSKQSILDNAPALPSTSTARTNATSKAWQQKSQSQQQQQQQQQTPTALPEPISQQQQNVTHVPAPTPTPGTAGTANTHHIDFYVVLDFEATCERDKRLQFQEVIEFPSVLVDAQRAVIVSEFQRYVRPIHNPRLTEFCTNLTGIPQQVVDESKTFASVYNDYMRWLDACGLLLPEASGRVAWVTCGDWDLKTMLPTQLRNPRPQNDADDSKFTLPQTAPEMLQRWVNLKTVYHDVTKRKISGMTDMAAAFNVQLRGHHHSGIDDCRNIASCLIALLRRQYPVKLTWGSFSSVELNTQTSRPARYPTKIPAADKEALSPQAEQALERAQAESKIQQQLEEAAKNSGRATTPASPATAATTTAAVSSISPSTQQQQQQEQQEQQQRGGGNRRKRGLADNSDEQQQRAGGGGAGGSTSSYSNAQAILPPVDVDTSRDAVAELFAAAGIKTSELDDDIQAKIFTRGGPAEMTQISKRLSSALRHNAPEWGLPMTLNGFVKVSDLLRSNRFHQATPLQVAALCQLSDKQRFSLFFGASKDTANTLFVRANQGHSIAELVVDMEKITNARDVPIAVHGTRQDAWNAIREQGLSRMQRQHIHFASGLPGEDGVVSGMRNSSDVLIYLNVAKALQDGIPLYRSSNGVILSPGVEGIISPAYFEKVVDRRSGRLLT